MNLDPTMKQEVMVFGPFFYTWEDGIFTMVNPSEDALKATIHVDGKDFTRDITPNGTADFAAADDSQRVVLHVYKAADQSMSGIRAKIVLIRKK